MYIEYLSCYGRPSHHGNEGCSSTMVHCIHFVAHSCFSVAWIDNVSTNMSTLTSYIIITSPGLSHMPKHARLYHHLCDMWSKVMCKVLSVKEGESGDPARLEWICIYMPN